jgi:DeoR/GlpR family transcriptional regulator of sugar metabolism
LLGARTAPLCSPNRRHTKDSFQRRLNQNVDAKIRLASAVAQTVASEETLLVDSSSTAYFVVPLASGQ